MGIEMRRLLDWDEIEALISKKTIDQLFECVPISQEQLETDIHLLKEIFPQKNLNAEQTVHYIVCGLSDLFEFEQFGGKSPNGVRLKMLHNMCEMLRSIEHIDGYSSFKIKFKSNEGMFNQLCATCYFHAFADVVAIELKHKGVDADIVVKLNNTVILVHVKTINQQDKVSKQIKFSGDLSISLAERSKSQGGKSLGILLLDGVIPHNLSDERANMIIAGIPAKPGRYELDFGGGDGAIVELDWTSSGRIRGIDLFRNFNFHLAEVEKKIVPSDDYMNVFLGSVGNGLTPRDIQSRPGAFESCRLDAEFFLAIYPTSTSFFQLSRTPVFSRTSRREFANVLESASPQQFQFP
jgi:hypothetical protein